MYISPDYLTKYLQCNNYVYQTKLFKLFDEINDLRRREM